MNKPCRIAVIGSGAVGSYYGARLAEAGHSVYFLLRRDYEAVRDGGLKVSSPDGDILLPRPLTAMHSADIGPVDWVICSLKATSLDAAEELIRPCVGEHTRILALMNGFGIEEQFAAWFGPARIFGGMAFTCINRAEPGHIRHLGYGTVTIGHIQNNPAELDTALALWSASKVKIVSATSLRRARWEKLCWNIPFSGLCVAAGGVTTESIVTDTGLRSAARDLMQEVIAAGNADLAANHEETSIDGDFITADLFRKTDTMGAYRPSLLIDFLEGRPMEVEAIFAKPLQRARSLGIKMPRLVLLTDLLVFLNAGRG
jgi:2-dehydropantoate 2-reductase